MKKGLIMEGGAMRGMFTCGVCDIFMENNITFDGAVGVSAGAAFGCNYKSKQNGRAIRYNMKYCRDKRYSSLGSLIKTGNIYNTDFCYGVIPNELDKFDNEVYDKNPMEFYVVCTDVETGEAVYHKYTGREESGFDWIRASASMPVVSKIVEIDGRKLLDGGIADSIPVKFLENMGYDKNIAILTQPIDYVKTKNKLMPVIKRMYSKYPSFVKVVGNRHIMYNKELEYIKQREAQGELLVIRPSKRLPVSRMEKNPDKLKLAYEIGRKTAEERLSAVKKYLNI